MLGNSHLQNDVLCIEWDDKFFSLIYLKNKNTAPPITWFPLILDHWLTWLNWKNSYCEYDWL